MAQRLVLVVGSQCDFMPELSFVEKRSEDLYAELFDAGWRPAIADNGLVLNPAFDELETSLSDAFAAAEDLAATLLFAFVGHGVASDRHAFYLMAKDSPYEHPTRRLNSKSALDFTHFLTERLRESKRIDGLVLLVDACQAHEGVEGAAERWTPVLAVNRGRMELLVASGKAAASGKAYDGCFTETVLSTFQAGLPKRGDDLLVGDLLSEITAKCSGQAQHLAYSGANQISGDPGLWLVPNIARKRDAVTGRSAAGLVDQLTRDVIATDSVRENLRAIDDARAARLRLVVGDPGSGKSTLLAILIRPRVVDNLTYIGDGYVKAAVFLDKTSTLESIAAELSEQLSVTVPGFLEATQAVAADLTQGIRRTVGSFDTSVILPLTRCGRDRRGELVPIVVDGLDQPHPSARNAIAAALQQLTHIAPADELGHIRVIAGVRSGEGIDAADEFAHASTMKIKPPTSTEIAQAVSAVSGQHVSKEDLARMVGDATGGGWLIGRMVGEIAGRAPEAPFFADLAELVTTRIELALRGKSIESARVLSLIGAAGVGPTLPIQLMAVALGEPEQPFLLAHIRDCVADLGALVSRGNPGTDRETLGLSHVAFLDPVADYIDIDRIDMPLLWAHQALIDAYERDFRATATPSGTDVGYHQVAGYWRNAAPGHYLGAGDALAAYEFLASLDGARAQDNRDRWTSWLPAFAATLGHDDPFTLLVRGNVTHWRGQTGDVAGALAEYESLLAAHLRVLGPDDKNTLATRNNMAELQGTAVGDAARAVAEFERLVADTTRIMGPDHPKTLAIRNNLAYWRAEAGDIAGAAAEYERLRADQERLLGPDHPETLKARGNFAGILGKGGYLVDAITELKRLLADRVRVLGEDHPDTLTTRNDLAYWWGQDGWPRRAVNQLEALLADQQRVQGSDHPRTLTTRLNLAGFRGEAGAPADAVAELEALLPDMVRVLGPDHPATVNAREYLANWRRRAGEAAGAVGDLERLLNDKTRLLGRDHPTTVTTRTQLAHSRWEAGDPTGAITEYEDLLGQLEQRLGPDHLDTLTIRNNLAVTRGEAVDPAVGVSELTALLLDVTPVLGRDHPLTLAVRGNLAELRGKGGDMSGAVAELKAVLRDRERILGHFHRETRKNRKLLASWQRRAELSE